MKDILNKIRGLRRNIFLVLADVGATVLVRFKVPNEATSWQFLALFPNA